MARKPKAKDASEEAIHLLDLTVQNFRRLRFAHITVDEGGRLIYITGKNEAGKSSVLDAIASLVHGGREIPAEPVNDQAAEGEKSFIRGKFSNDFTVERRFTENGTYLTVLSRDGGSYKQAKLNEWVGGISGDPIHLWNLPAPRLLKVLLTLTDAPDAVEKLAAFDERQKQLHDSRTPFLSTIQAAQRTPAPDGERPADIDVVEVYGEMKTLHQQAFDRKQKRDEVGQAKRSFDEAQRHIEVLEKELATWREASRERGEALGRLTRELASMEDPSERLSECEALVAKAEAEEEARDTWKAWDDLQAKAEEAKKSAEAITAQIDTVKEQRGAYVAGIHTKIDSLTFRDDLTPLLHGREFHAASGSQRARFQADVLFALNPKLKIIAIDEGAALDADYLKTLYDDAVRRNFQIWICTIQEGIEGEIKIVEGRTQEEVVTS
jgi:uncharacterized protein YhaN